VVASKHICVMMRVAYGDFYLSASSIASSGMLA
jgi:hypothetical protein